MVESAPSTPRRGRRALVITLVSVLGVLLVIGGLVWWNIQSKLNQVETIDNAFPEESLRPTQGAPNAEGQTAMNVLLLGSDSRSNSSDSLLSDLGNRADTIMVAHIPADRKSVQLMSIMRDSWVEIPGYGENKVNAALAFGGVPLMVQTVEGIIDQRIDHVAVVDFNGFKQITTAMGGVTFKNPNAFTASPPVNRYYPADQITLQGDDALAYVRERKAFVDGDYQRVANQQVFLKAIMSQALSRGTLTNPVKLNDLLGATTPYIATDKGFDAGTIYGLATSLASVKDRDVTSFTLPTNGTGMIGDQSVVLVNWDEVNVLRQKFADDQLAGYAPAAKP